MVDEQKKNSEKKIHFKNLCGDILSCGFDVPIKKKIMKIRTVYVFCDRSTRLFQKN